MPTSLNIAWPQSVAQPEKLTLNLRGSRWAIGLRRNRSVTACAHGVMSSTSNGQAPARWQPATLRTVSPQASRLVRPTEPRSRSTSGTSRSCTKWNCAFWRVVRWPQPREYSVAIVPSVSSCSGVTRPWGIFTRTIWLVPPWR